MKKLFIEIIQTDLKNEIESGMLNPQQQLIAINQALRDLSSIDNPEINKVIEKYRAEQKKQEDLLAEAQKAIMENAHNIYEHLKELKFD